MFQNEIFVGEFFAINRFASGSVIVCKIAALTHLQKSEITLMVRCSIYMFCTHEIGYDAMECAALVPKTLFMCAETAEIFSGFWYDIGS